MTDPVCDWSVPKGAENPPERGASGTEKEKRQTRKEYSFRVCFFAPWGNTSFLPAPPLEKRPIHRGGTSFLAVAPYPVRRNPITSGGAHPPLDGTSRRLFWRLFPSAYCANRKHRPLFAAPGSSPLAFLSSVRRLISRGALQKGGRPPLGQRPIPCGGTSFLAGAPYPLRQHPLPWGSASSPLSKRTGAENFPCRRKNPRNPCILG